MGGGTFRGRALALAASGLAACGGPAQPSGLEAPLERSGEGRGGASAGAPAGAAGEGPDEPEAAAGSGVGPARAETPPAPSNVAAAPGAAEAPDASATTALPGGAVFADGQVLEVRLTLSASDLIELEEHGDREAYVPARARLASAGGDPVELPEIGVRHKGNWTLHHCWDDFGGVRSHDGDCAKLSLKLDFDEYTEDTRFDGLERLNLHASMGDASRMHELLAYQTFRAFGVDAPRAIPARVYVNDEPLGLFIAVEDVDGHYTQAHFPAGPDGNLYKEIWPNASFEDARFALALETNGELADVSDMRRFADAVARSTPESFGAEVEPFLDVDELARYIAVDRALRNWDGVTAFYDPRTPHNFFWYHDDGPDPRFHLIPWDMDDTYWAYDPYTHPEPPVTAPPIPDLNVRPAHCEPRPIWSADGSAGTVTPGRCDALLDALVTRHWARVDERGRELLAGPFAPDNQRAALDAWAARVAPIIVEDPTLEPSAWENAVADLQDVFEGSATAFYGLLEEGLLEEPAVSASETND